MTKELDVKGFIDGIVARTQELYSCYFHDLPEKLTVFRDNLEDLLLYDMRTINGSNQLGTGLLDRKGIVSRDIVIALDSIGLHKKDVKGLYDDTSVTFNMFNRGQVATAIRANETKYLGMDIGDFAKKLMADDHYVDSTSDFLDFAFAVGDRKSNYLDSYNDENAPYFHALDVMWAEKKKLMDEDSFTYKALKNIIDDDAYHHYSMIEREAIKRLCHFADKLENDGLSSIALNEIYNMDISLSCAKMVNPDKLRFFTGIWNDSISKHLSETKASALRRIFKRFNNNGDK